jgi:transcriptional regulator CtsR
MGNLADLIEQYLRGLLIQQGIVELQRRELARMFRCAPSQINYVLDTRFNLERGYLIKSKRGGGGYIRISQVQWRTPESMPLIVEKLVPSTLTGDEVENLLDMMVEKGLIPPKTGLLAFNLIAKEFQDFPPEQAGPLRARFVRTLLLVLGMNDEE